jgi:hypothetical protein
MFCSQCGENNADNALVCVRCGKTLQASAPPPLQTPGTLIPPGATPTVPNYLVFAILTTIFCCLPAGIVGIVYAAQVNGKLQAGDYAGAQTASNNAKMWCLISLGLGLAVTIGYVVLMMLGVLTGIHR